MAYDETLADRIRAVLSDRTDVEEKKMFGGITFMVGGQMCCGVLKDDLVVKVGPDGFEALVALAHVRPFDFSGRPMVGTVYVAGAGLTSDQTLGEWVQRGLEFVAKHPKETRRTTSKRQRSRA